MDHLARRNLLAAQGVGATFVHAGPTVLSQHFYFEPGGDGRSLYTGGGSAEFRNIVVTEP